MQNEGIPPLGCSTSQAEAASHCLLGWISHGRESRDSLAGGDKGFLQLFLLKEVHLDTQVHLEQGTVNSSPAVQEGTAPTLPIWDSSQSHPALSWLS